jgi:NADH dehydrogenase [ubiquinone] 1 alpha subcomplex assembly factor 1
MKNTDLFSGVAGLFASFSVKEDQAKARGIPQQSTYKKNKFIGMVVSVGVLLLSAATVPADQSISEFDSSDQNKLRWRITDDGVMGGLSKGRVSFTDTGTMRFAGNLSLENNGGFSTVRTSSMALDLSDFEGLVMRVKGDGRVYQLRLSTDARYRFSEVSFKTEFPTVKDEWREIKIPFDKLLGSWRGRLLKNESFDPTKIQRIGLLLGDKKPGYFQMEVDWIRAYKASDTSAD